MTEQKISKGSSVDQYLARIGRVPLLTHEEEITLGRMIQRKCELEAEQRELTAAERVAVKKGKRALDRMVSANLRLVVHVVRRYSHQQFKSLEMLDLIQEGSTGLMRAAERFDPQRGYKFSTYAYWWIRQAVVRVISQQDRTIRRPHHISELAAKIPRAMSTLMQELHRMPTAEELAVQLKVPAAEIELLRHRGSGIVSLDATATTDEDSSRLVDFIAYEWDEEENDLALDMELRRPVLEAAMAKLTEKERDFLTRHFGLLDGTRVTKADIAREAGTSRERVRQIIERAVRKLRYQLVQAGLNPLALLDDEEDQTDKPEGKAAAVAKRFCNVEIQDPEKLQQLLQKHGTAGRSLRSISEALAAAGILTGQGKPLHPGTVGRLLKHFDISREEPPRVVQPIRPLPALSKSMSMEERRALWRDLGARRLAAG